MLHFDNQVVTKQSRLRDFEDKMFFGRYWK